jgi:hypothetical protein
MESAALLATSEVDSVVSGLNCPDASDAAEGVRGVGGDDDVWYPIDTIAAPPSGAGCNHGCNQLLNRAMHCHEMNAQYTTRKRQSPLCQYLEAAALGRKAMARHAPTAGMQYI